MCSIDYKQIASIINIVINEYEIISNKCIISNNTNIINLKKKYVEHLQNENNLKYIMTYRNNLVNETLKLSDKLGQLKIISRVKTVNSIRDKINKYIFKEGNGKYPINKCLNDIFGMRIIISNESDYTYICNKLNADYKNCKAYVRQDNEYEAVHFYFKVNNKMFPWELQIWKQCDEDKNKLSHSKYKQQYTKTEYEGLKVNSKLVDNL